jgi:hypothetical protein
MAAGAALAIAGLSAGGMALASARTPAAVIRACASNHNGALRLASRCTSTEHAVTWNSTGPRGSIGPSNAYSVYHDLGLSLPTGGAFGTIGSLPLAAGTYVVFAKADVYNNTANLGNVTCRLVLGTVSFDLTFATVQPFTAVPTSWNVVGTLSSAAHARLECFSDVSDSSILEVKITAIRVGSLANNPF